jgi:phosphate/sulfate permease
MLFWMAAALVANEIWLHIRERHEHPIHTTSWAIAITIGTGATSTTITITTLSGTGKSRLFIWPMFLLVTSALLEALIDEPSSIPRVEAEAATKQR